MGQAVLPFIKYIVLQLFVVAVGLILFRDKVLGVSGVLKSWIFGQMLLFAVLQIMAVPMILLRWKFNILFWSYCGAAVVLFGFGLWRLIQGKTKIRIRMLELKPLELLLLMIIILLILWQACDYFFGIHLDEDDARWLAEANDAITSGDMITRDFDTGIYIGIFDELKDVTSPWPMMYAVVAKVLNTRPSIFAHTVFAPVEIILLYGVYWLIGSECLRKLEAKLMFLLACIVINLFFAQTSYTQSVFSLVRIWQGKATIAAVIVPLLFYLFVCLNKHNRTEDWIRVVVVGCAACLISAAGISILIIMIGIYGLYHIIFFRKWKQIPMWFASLIPSTASFLTYFLYKG